MAHTRYCTVVLKTMKKQQQYQHQSRKKNKTYTHTYTESQNQQLRRTYKLTKRVNIFVYLSLSYPFFFCWWRVSVFWRRIESRSTLDMYAINKNKQWTQATDWSQWKRTHEKRKRTKKKPKRTNTQLVHFARWPKQLLAVRWCRRRSDQAKFLS